MSEFAEPVEYREGPERTDRSSHGAEGGPATMLGELADASWEVRNAQERAEGLLERVLDEIKGGGVDFDTALDFLNSHPSLDARSRSLLIRALDRTYPDGNVHLRFKPKRQY